MRQIARRDDLYHTPRPAPTGRRRRPLVALLAMLILSRISIAADQPAPTDPADAAVAEHLCEVAQSTLRAQTITPPTWQAATALLEAAARLNPAEPRYWRLLAEAQLRQDNAAGAAAAFASLMRADPGSRVAQARLIDIYLARS
jgi:cytochrome c-type biogenesis protein CcmH/NrfG